jgi:REP element-mobilizing transposase RayT
MNKYNPEIHHRRSIRLRGYDYAREGMYFITLCCQNMAHLFGQIIDGEMVLNEYGTIAFNEWLNTPNVRKNVELGAFVVMPNHVHGIIIINCRRGELHSPLNDTIDDGTGELHSPLNDTIDNGTGECNSPLIGPSQTIGAIVRGYKSSVTKQLNLLNIGCAVWQRNYYERIIRDEFAYRIISEYIIKNPLKWKGNKFNSK